MQVLWENGALFTHKQWNFIISKNMEETGDHSIKWNKPDHKKTNTTGFYLYVKSKKVDLKEVEKRIMATRDCED
jgi:hypothetical protein